MLSVAANLAAPSRSRESQYAVDGLSPLLGSDAKLAENVYPASQLADYVGDLAQRQQVAHDAHHPLHSLQE
jgi:hypothetical protein